MANTRVADLLVAAADAWSTRDEIDASTAALGDAVALVEPDDPDRAAMLACRVAHNEWLLHRPQELAWWRRRANEIGERAGEVARARVLYEEVALAVRQGHDTEAQAALPAARDAARLVGDTAIGALLGYRLDVAVALYAGSPIEHLAERSPETAEGVPHDVYAPAAGAQVELLALLGRWDDAVDRAQAARRTLGEDTSLASTWRFDSTDVLEAIARGRWDDASDLLVELRGDLLHANLLFATWAAWLAALRGDRDALAAIEADRRRGVFGTSNYDAHLSTALDYGRFVTGEPVTPGPVPRPSGMLTMATIPAACEMRARGADPAAASAASSWFRRLAGAGTLPSAIADRIDGLLAARDDPAAAVQLLDRAARTFAALGDPVRGSSCPGRGGGDRCRAWRS